LIYSLASLSLIVAIGGPVNWAYLAFWAIFAIGLVAIIFRGDWQKARGFDKLILFGPIFYAAPLAGFGTEHFTLTQTIASIVPPWMPWHLFWAYFVGACFIAAPLSIVTRIQARLSARVLAFTFFFFVMLMDGPGLIQDPRNRIVWALSFRELSFSSGALAVAAGLGQPAQERVWRILATIARVVIASAILLYSFEQFRHGTYVPAIPLGRVTPAWIWGHAVWTYLVAVVYLVAGIPLLVGRKSRAAAVCIALAVLLVEFVVYVPIAVVERSTIVGFNFMADTLMYCGAVLLLASAMPRNVRLDARQIVPSISQGHDHHAFTS
jgi:uncharacterized membrane protein YphA (DoxX/SURF4 family)